METLSGKNSEKLSIIIVNFQSKHHLDKCLASVWSKVKPRIDVEVIIVNNDEQENLEDVAERFSGVRVIDHKKNVGFGRANNLGAKASLGEFLLLLNPDAEIISENVADILEEFKKDDQLGIIGSGLLNLEGKMQEWSAGAETGLGDIIMNNLGLPKSKKIWENSEKVEADWVSATALFISRELFDSLSGFDENIFMYFEDMDLCKRAREAGKKVLFFPGFRVMHYCGGSHNSPKAQKKSYYDSQEYYFRKHKNKLQYYGLKFLRRILAK